MKERITCVSPSDLRAIAERLISTYPEGRVFAFYGDMGTGKTTFIKEVCAVIGVRDMVNSPTFSIINEYEYQAGLAYHFDFYRIKKQEEALDIGIEEYFYSGYYCFIEWPSMVEVYLPEDTVEVCIEKMADSGSRTICF